jgi:metal-responsive CopG/Arc/MetJ family transcriptional regulator
MTHHETAISLNMSSDLVEKIDTIAKQKSLNRSDVIIDACAYYCQFYDMHREESPKTMRSIFFDLARHDTEFRNTLRDVLHDESMADSPNKK